MCVCVCAGGMRFVRDVHVVFFLRCVVFVVVFWCDREIYAKVKEEEQGTYYK